MEVEPGRRAKPKRRPGLLLALNHLAQLGPLHGGFHRRQRVLARGPASLGLGRGGIWILRRRGRGRTPAGQLGLAQRLRILKRVAVLRGSLLKVGAVLRVSHRRFLSLHGLGFWLGFRFGFWFWLRIDLGRGLGLGRRLVGSGEKVSRGAAHRLWGHLGHVARRLPCPAWTTACCSA